MKTILAIVSTTRQSCRDRLEGVHQYAREHGFHVRVVERLFREVNVRELLDTWHPIGVVAECGSGGAELTPQAFGDVPIVYIDADAQCFGSCFDVCLDTGSVGRLAANYLLSLGRMNYAYVPFRVPVFWCAERRQSFEAELVRHGLTCHVFKSSRGSHLARWLTDLSRWLAKLPRPCCIFSANDGMAEHVMNACLELGLEIPDDVAVLGVDNEEPICENCLPTISSVAVDFFDAGYRAAELLDAHLKNPRSEPTILFYRAMRVIVRQSTRLVTVGRNRVDGALEYIRRHAQEGIGVGDVVREMNQPRRTAELQFRKVTGRSILDAINDVRFTKVLNLLSNSRQSLKTIPDFSGFPSSSALRKAFRHRMGCSMSEWRAKNGV